MLSLSMEMAERHEHVMDEVSQVVAPLISLSTNMHAIVQETDVCQILSSLFTYAYVTGYEAQDLVSTLQPLSQLYCLPDVGQTVDSVTVGPYKLTRKDLQCLDMDSCLNDQVILLLSVPVRHFIFHDNTEANKHCGLIK